MNSATKVICLLLLAVNLFSFSSAFGEDPFGPTTSAGNGWSQSDWFGWYYDPYEPYFMHAQHGWVYAQEWGNWIWMWDYSVKEWFATSEAFYPMLYDFLEDSWFWYYEGSASPRWYAKMGGDSLYSEYHEALIPLEVIEMVDSAMGLTGEGDGGDEEPDMMSQVMGYVLLALIGDPETMVCPSLSRTPDVIDIMNLPPTVEISLDFGDGCTPEDTDITLAGSITLLISNLAFTEAGILADILLSVDSLSSDGTLLMDGDIVGSVNVGMGLDGTTFDVTVAVDSLTTVDYTVSGEVVVTGSTTTDEEDELVAATVNATVNDAQVNDEPPMNGTFGLTMDEDSIDVVMGMNNASDSMSLSLTAIPNEATGGYLMRTNNTAYLMGYFMSIDDVLMDPTVCETMPASGSINIGINGVNYRVIFTGDCEEGFVIRKSTLVLAR